MPAFAPGTKRPDTVRDTGGKRRTIPLRCKPIGARGVNTEAENRIIPFHFKAILV